MTEAFAGMDVILDGSNSQLMWPRPSSDQSLTSLLISTANMLRLISVFIPCLCASLSKVSSAVDTGRDSGCLAVADICLASTKGLPVHADPTSHHLPFLSAARRSASEAFRGSWVNTERDTRMYNYVVICGTRTGSMHTMMFLRKAIEELA